MIYVANKSHQCRQALHTATNQAEDRAPNLGRHGLARDAVNQYIASNGGRRGENKRHGETQDRWAHRHEQDDQQTIGDSACHQSDQSRTDQAGTGGLGPTRHLHTEHEGSAYMASV